jgi:LCP family protein required for cell wall assembly
MISDPYQDTQPYPVYPRILPGPVRSRRGRWALKVTTRALLVAMIAGVMVTAIYLLLPLRTHILVMGTDSRDPSDPVGRTDTMILASVDPFGPKVGMLSIPRDLYVEIPGVGENRVNAAFFFGELDQPGGGPAAAIATIDHNFGIRPDHYVLVQFEGLKEVVDALGGVSITLTEPMSGYPAGTHTLDGIQALAFVRDRAGSDDFFRMARGQLFLRALMSEVMRPTSWPKLPAAAIGGAQVVETDVPIWQWPRLAVAFLRAGPDGINSVQISRAQVEPFTTGAGAQVLGPNWAAIDPLVESVTGQAPAR